MSTLAKLGKSNSERQLFESKLPPFNVYVDRLHHPEPPVKRLEYRQSSGTAPRSHPVENGWYALAPDGRLASGSMDVLERKEKATTAMHHETERQNAWLQQGNLEAALDPLHVRRFILKSERPRADAS